MGNETVSISLKITACHTKENKRKNICSKTV
jgi:hypothetical protein